MCNQLPIQVCGVACMVRGDISLSMKRERCHRKSQWYTFLGKSRQHVQNTTVSITIFTHTGKTGNETGERLLVVRFHFTKQSQIEKGRK